MAPPTFIPALVDHCKQHLLMLYSAMIYHAVTAAAGIENLDELGTSAEDQNALDAAMSRLMPDVLHQFSTAVGGAMQQLAPLAQQAQAMRQQAPQPPDPIALEKLRGQTQIQIEQMRLQADQQREAARAQAEGQRAQLEATARNTIEANKTKSEHIRDQSTTAADAAIDAARVKTERDVTAARLQVDREKIAAEERQHALAADAQVRREQIEDQTALTIANMRESNESAAQAAKETPEAEREPTSKDGVE